MRALKSVLGLVLGANVVLAQGPQLAPPLFSSLRWRNIGPATFSGRFTDIAVARVAGQPDQIYVAASTGGVFKSTNGGTSWTPVFDQVNALMSMGSLAVAPSSPNIVWVGTGEPNNPPHRWGDGVYKSTDGGKTWTSMGLRETRQIGRILVNPTNPNIVFVAAQGSIWGPNPERGLFKTVDGGEHWRKVLYVDENTGANDVVMIPGNPQVLLATSYQRQRKSFGGIPTGPGSDLYKSVDGGETWTKVRKGLPTAERGRIGLSVSPVDPKLVYADVEVTGAVYPGEGRSVGADCPPDVTGRGGRGAITRGQFDSGQGGVYRSLDGGDSWEQVNSRIDQPSGFFIQIRADPKDRNRVYRLGTGLYISDDQGKTFRTANTGLHSDYMSLWIDPDDNNHIIVGNDGGLGISWDRGVSWLHSANLAVGQFYETYIDNRDPFWVCGGAQDNGDWCVPSAVRDRSGLSNEDVVSLGGGDGMHARVDPFDTTYALFEGQGGSMSRLSLTSYQAQSVKPGPALRRPISCLEPDAQGGDTPRQILRWGWDTQILFSSVTPGVVYAGANVVFRSNDRGGSWKQISPDLTAKVDRDTVYVMGVALGAVNYSPNGTKVDRPDVLPVFGQITTIGESALDPKVLYVGTEEGLVQVTRDGGTTWTNVTKNIPGLPPFLYVSTVFPSQHVAGRVYATFDGHAKQDDRPYVYVSNDYGKSWRAITSGLPDAPVTRITEHPHDRNVLVVGHSRGVHFSNDGGASWQSLNTNLPTVPVTSVVIHPRDNALVVGTFGRGIWILDDVGPLQALTSDRIKSDALMVSVTRGREWNLFSRDGAAGAGEFRAPNPEFDPVISYYVRNGAAGPATIAISDAAGTRIRTMQSPAARGLNRATWDMHMDSAIPSAVATGAGRGGRGGSGGGAGGGGGRGRGSGEEGPLVLPGKYSVAITIPGISTILSGDLTVQGDPSDHFSAADRRARQDVMMNIYGLQKSLVTAGTASRTLSGQQEAIRQDLTRGGETAAATRADSLAAQVQRLSSEANRLGGIATGLLRAVESFNSVPTVDQRQQIDWMFADAARLVSSLNRASQTVIPALYTQYAKGATPRVLPIVPAPVRKP